MRTSREPQSPSRTIGPTRTIRSSVCPATTDPTQAPIFGASRPAEQSEWIACAMPDYGGQVDRCAEETPRRPVGSLASEEVKALNRAMFVFLGLAETEASHESAQRPFTPSRSK